MKDPKAKAAQPAAREAAMEAAKRIVREAGEEAASDAYTHIDHAGLPCTPHWKLATRPLRRPVSKQATPIAEPTWKN
jgi:hypothetical protein